MVGPGERADDADAQQPAQRHVGASGDERHRRAEKSGEAAEQQGLATVAVEVAVDSCELGGPEADPGAVALQEAAAEPAADQEADGVSQEGRRKSRGR